MIGLIDLATVYTPDPVTGEYTVLDRDNLACRLALVNTVSGDVGPGRAELASTRRLIWDPSYEMPDASQVEIGDRRWNIQEGSQAAVRGPNGAIVYRRAEVMRAV